MALMVVTCRRAAHPAFGWIRLSASQLPRRCSLIEQAPGKLGSQIRKGRLSEEDASRGKAGSSGGRPEAAGEDASGTSGERDAGLTDG